uniref:Uncharacterized protein n=1 Tax=viral metagenome TaxID=1070528 RepID=A0A6M3XFU6_9ZZZZ
MKGRYAVFSGLRYYSCGGWDDLQSRYDTIDELAADEAAWKLSKWKLRKEWYQVVDLKTGEILESQ